MSYLVSVLQTAVLQVDVVCALQRFEFEMNMFSLFVYHARDVGRNACQLCFEVEVTKSYSTGNIWFYPNKFILCLIPVKSLHPSTPSSLGAGVLPLLDCALNFLFRCVKKVEVDCRKQALGCIEDVGWLKRAKRGSIRACINRRSCTTSPNPSQTTGLKTRR